MRTCGSAPCGQINGDSPLMTWTDQGRWAVTSGGGGQQRVATGQQLPGSNLQRRLLSLWPRFAVCRRWQQLSHSPGIRREPDAMASSKIRLSTSRAHMLLNCKCVVYIRFLCVNMLLTTAFALQSHWLHMSLNCEHRARNCVSEVLTTQSHVWSCCSARDSETGASMLLGKGTQF